MNSLQAASAKPWWPAASALLVATAVLGAALLIPLAFSDPNGVDPYMVRLSIGSSVLLVVCCVFRRTQAMRPVLLAVVAATVSFTVLSALPQLIVDVMGQRATSGYWHVLGVTSPAGDFEVFWASVAQLVVTAAAAALALPLLPRDLRPHLRLGRFGGGALLAAVLGTAVLVAVVMALPATWLGRLALQPIALGRDMPLLGPANALQGLAQEVQFRGMLMGSLERVMPQRFANLSQACFFGLAHLAVNYEGPVGPFVPVTIGVGLLLGWVVQRTNSLWPAIVIHAAADVLIAVGVLPGLYGF
ncbi:MAG: CPBP family intramembrane metalloprotease [Candidatus Dormibacteraeota bacterium]|nr:CPBP family intramembrane metalloprotease [Candidatus Dormibacteraeota bacterium]